MAAPVRNANALHHGLAVTIGTLPPRFGKLVAQVAAFRRLLESEVIAQKGELSIVDALLVQSAARIERHCQLCLKWLRDAYKELSPDQRLAHSRELASATERRDRIVKQLGIDVLPRRDADTAAFNERFQRAIQSRSPRVIDAESGSTSATPPAAAAPTAAAAAAAGTPADDQAIPPADATGEPPEAVAGDVVTDGYARPRQWSR